MLDIHIPGYRIIRELGSGGMATVYLAVQESVNREVALKIMAPALAADRSFSDRFLKEAKIVADLQHPNITAVFDMGVYEYHNYIVMEHVEAGDLKHNLESGLSTEQIFNAILEIAYALSFAHEKGYVHRDVKSENILFRADGTAVLSDFGIAKTVISGTKMTGTGMSIGTPHYMSPEQARGQDLDGRADFYSLGVVLYEALTGTKPYDSEDTFAIGLMHINEPIPLLPEHIKQFQPLIDNLCAKSPDDRYSHVNQLKRDYDAILGGERFKRPTHATSVIKSVDRSSKSSTFTWLFGGAFLALATVFGLYYIAVDRSLNDKQITSSITGNLIKNGILSVSSTPEGARISLNGVQIGETPAYIEDLPTGKHELKIEKRFYKPIVVPVNLKSNEIFEKAFNMDIGFGGVTVTSNPNGAWIKIDGKKVGNTPLTIKNIVAGEQAITVGMDKYYESVETIAIDDENTAKLDVILSGGNLVAFKKQWVTPEKFYQLSANELVKNAFASKSLEKKIEYYKKALSYDEKNTEAIKGLQLITSNILKDTDNIQKSGNLALLAAIKSKLDFIGQQYYSSNKYDEVALKTQSRNKQISQFLQKLGGFSEITPSSSKNSYYLLKNEVTNEAWNLCVVDNSCKAPTYSEKFANNQQPIVGVSYNDLTQFLVWVFKKTGLQFAIPTYQQWSYSTGSSNQSFYWEIETVANSKKPHASCATCESEWDKKSTSPVRSFSPNKFGLYDLHGNAMEIVYDCQNINKCDEVIAVGGSWIQPEQHMNVSRKFPFKVNQSGQNISFRIAIGKDAHVSSVMK